MYRLAVPFVLVLTLIGSQLPAADVTTITHGDEVDLKNHLVPGKYVLFDFYADWCGPCRGLEPTLISLASQNQSSLALRKVDVVDWSSPVAKQFRIGSIPHLKLYGPDGALVAEGGAQSVLSALDAALGGRAVHNARNSDPVDTSSSMVPFLAFLALIAIVAYLLFFKGRAPVPATHPPIETTAGHPNEPERGDASWFVMMQGSLNGPFSTEELHDLKQRRCIDDASRIRRKGDTEWQTLSDLPPSG